MLHKPRPRIPYLTIKAENLPRTWYVVAKNDKTIHPDLERFMAKRMKAKTTELASCHVMMLSHPAEVLRVVEEAANFKY